MIITTSTSRRNGIFAFVGIFVAVAVAITSRCGGLLHHPSVLCRQRRLIHSLPQEDCSAAALASSRLYLAVYLGTLHTIMPHGIELSCPMASNFDGLGFDSSIQSEVVSVRRPFCHSPAPWLGCFIIYLPSVLSHCPAPWALFAHARPSMPASLRWSLRYSNTSVLHST